MPHSSTSRGARTRQRILAYIAAFVEERGYSPTIREIADALAYSGTSSIQQHLVVLEQQGHLTRVPGMARTYRVVGGGE